MPLTSICVFAGSSAGSRPEYAAAARALGLEIAGRGCTLVYGGAHVGLMGVVADTVLSAGGRVRGVIPQFLADKEVAHGGLTDLHIVSSMHERKEMMADLSDGFVALPGGYGTLEEFVEVLTWAQLGLHEKPCGLLDIAGYYDGLLAVLDRAVTDRFLKPVHRSMLLVASDPRTLLDAFDAYRPPVSPKWIKGE